MEQFWRQNGWDIAYRHRMSGRSGQFASLDDLPIHRVAIEYLRRNYPSGIYHHQRETMDAFCRGEHTCMTTGTSSGKTLPFLAGAIDLLAKSPHSKILALYPMKALGYEQEERWQSALEDSGLKTLVGRIDGDVKSKDERIRILTQCNVVVMTPDVVHAWLLPNVGEPKIAKFIRAIKMIVVDEVHTYTGVFGSNSAFLFRRLHHLNDQLGGSYRYVCASATMNDAHRHLTELFGVEFTVIDSSSDSSPRHEMEIQLISPPATSDFLTAIAQMLLAVSQRFNRFIAFTDSRKQTEHIATILAREGQPDEGDEYDPQIRTLLTTLDVLPYRAGYEEYDRKVIQDRLTNGKLKGVISTSALELGLDIPGIDAGVLLGVPYSNTSFLQRIGRIGRQQTGSVFVIKAGSLLDDLVFRTPELLFERPLSESALYLENGQLQYIHALCLARTGGEHDQLGFEVSEDEISLSTTVAWPIGFREMCRRERTGEITVDYQTLKQQGGDRPNIVFPLRDVESQFQVELPHGPDIRRLGSLSYGQVLREAYPGAVYYYATTAYRVTKVDTTKRLVAVRHEKRYTTTPATIPTKIYPNLSEGNIYSSRRYGELLVIECNVQLQDSVSGFKERRGRTETATTYPLPANANIYFKQNLFTRYYFSSGVILTHPILLSIGVNLEVIAGLLYEGYLMTIPFERRDIGFGADRHRNERPGISAGSKFLSLFDHTYGSLRLSGRLAETATLQAVLKQSLDILDADDAGAFPPEVRLIVETFWHDSLVSPQDHFVSFDEVAATLDENATPVIKPGSIGLAIKKGNQEVTIEDVFYHPMKGLSYRVKYVSTSPSAENGMDIIWSVAEIGAIPGVSEMANYDTSTGRVQ